ncbi:high affinity immunoglobulin gamma Fc receptor I-like isoform X2 [Chiloscyllium plagiosum]|uniref:high affinity immunoglobulin gamma Fc receptor I-like isoform X2 n=1 Tax=Chiloscyllium plagiosum TaxID=36176 RepID=UPI001CB7BCBA|nr:high affinity immunoglobulin gamma Fc receptor I-like isoform X2 [Chiloscyllium plagiosum]
MPVGSFIRRPNWIINKTTKEFREKTYIIEAATKEDVGEYRCQSSTSAHKTPYSNSILVRVSSPDSLMSIESEPEALWYTQTLKLNCQFIFHAQDEFIYTFYREGSVVAEIRTRNKSVSFEKEQVTSEDAGWYRCQMQFVKHPKGPVYTSAYKYVDVQESPVILQVNPRLQRAGDSIILNCTCAQDHLCGRGQISFHRNETIVSSDSESHNIYHIQQATLMDSGWYRCMVSQNLSTFMSLRVEVTVQNPPRDFALIIGGSAVAAVLLITFLLLFTVCRLRQKEGVQDIANSQPSRDVSGSTSGDIVYSAVQVNREERDHIRARRESREADSHVTYASLMHLERTRDQDVRAGRQEDNGSSIYQNIRRS